MSEIADALVRAGFPADTTTSRLAGLTNVNHLVEHDGARYVLRVPGAGTSEYIDRRVEEVAARSAAAAGVNAEVVFFDAADGLMVTRFVDGAATMTGETFRDLGAVARAGRAFRRLHTTAAPFATDFVLFPMIDEYKALLAAKRATLPDGYDTVQARAAEARAALEAHPVPLAPCHCDPLCENFLDTGDRMYVIDYEYSGNNDPMWDLGDLSVEGGFGPEQDAALLDAYFDGDVPAARGLGRMVIVQGDVRPAVDAVGRDPARQRATRPTTSGRTRRRRFERCQALMDRPDYQAHLDAILAG
jgi:thiamine kinase-like enzyme